MKMLPLLVFMLGCTQLGPLLTEQATVVDLPYTPGSHSTAFTTNGHVAFVSTKEQYAVVFQCEHGRFVISGDKAREIWPRLKKDKQVTVVYQQEIDSDGKQVGFHFVGVE